MINMTLMRVSNDMAVAPRDHSENGDSEMQRHPYPSQAGHAENKNLVIYFIVYVRHLSCYMDQELRIKFDVIMLFLI